MHAVQTSWVILLIRPATYLFPPARFRTAGRRRGHLQFFSFATRGRGLRQQAITRRLPRGVVTSERRIHLLPQREKASHPGMVIHHVGRCGITAYRQSHQLGGRHHWRATYPHSATSGCISRLDWRRWIAMLAGLLVLIGSTLHHSGATALVRDRLRPLSATVTFQERLHLWSACWQMWSQRPVAGWGIGSFAMKAGDYTNKAPSAEQVARQGASLSTIAHNEYLQVSSEQGLVGLTLYLLVLGCTFRRSWRALHTDNGKLTKILLTGCLGAVGAQCVDALCNPAWHFVEVSLLLWLLLGICAGIATSSDLLLDKQNAPAGQRCCANAVLSMSSATCATLLYGFISSAATAAEVYSAISVSDGPPIEGGRLGQLISQFIPAQTYSFVLLTECFGGASSRNLQTSRRSPSPPPALPAGRHGIRVMAKERRSFSLRWPRARRRMSIFTE